MTDRLVGRTALVTGASRGIGRGAAIALAAEGADVFGLARTVDALARLSSEHGITPLPADLTDADDVWTTLDEMMDGLGGAPDIVVNAAGLFGIASCASETVRAFDDQLRVNTRGPFLVIRSVLPRMIERGSGLFVNVGSVAGRKAFPGNGAYSASKFGLRGLHEVLQEEVRGTGVRASLVEPAATDTEIWNPLYPDDDPNLPNRADMLSTADVAEAIVFVATRPEGVTVPVLSVERS